MIVKLLLPAGLAFIMFGIGLTLQVSDFTSVFRRPKVVLLGLFCQLVLLPLLAFGLLQLTPVDPVLAVGIMILAASPGGITSNLLTHFARGDTALSISLTAISSLAGMITIPLIVGLSYQYFELGTAGSMPVWKMTIGVFVISSLPVMVGVATNHFNSGLAQRIEAVARPLSIAVFGLIVIGAFASQWSAMMINLPVIGLTVIGLNISIMAVGYMLAIYMKAGVGAARAISLEGGLQNGAIGIFVATTLLGNSLLAVPSITYALIMNVSAAAFILIAQFSQTSQKRI